MRSRITGQVTRVHSDTSVKSEKVRHRCSSKNCASRFRVLFVFHVLHHDVAVLADIIAVKARNVIDILVRNAELTGMRVIAFPASRDRGNADDLIAFVKIGSLIFDIDLYARAAQCSVTVPIRNAVAAFLTFTGEGSAVERRIQVTSASRDIRVRSTTSQTEGANS